MSDSVPVSSAYDVAVAGADVPGAPDQFRIAIDAIPGLVWTALPDGSVDFLNQRWLDYTGLTREQALGWGWQAAISPEDRSRLVDYWRWTREPGWIPGRPSSRPPSSTRSNSSLRYFTSFQMLKPCSRATAPSTTKTKSAQVT